MSYERFDDDLARVSLIPRVFSEKEKASPRAVFPARHRKNRTLYTRCAPLRTFGTYILDITMLLGPVRGSVYQQETPARLVISDRYRYLSLSAQKKNRVVFLLFLCNKRPRSGDLHTATGLENNQKQLKHIGRKRAHLDVNNGLDKYILLVNEQ